MPFVADRAVYYHVAGGGGSVAATMQRAEVDRNQQQFAVQVFR